MCLPDAHWHCLCGHKVMAVAGKEWFAHTAVCCVCLPGASGAVVCINPGRLLKGNSGGTYAHITVAQQSDRTQLAASNCRVAIIKI